MIFGAVGGALGVVLIGVVVARWRSGSPAYRAAVAPLWIAALLGTAATAWTPLVSVWVHSPQHAWTLLLRYPSTARSSRLRCWSGCGATESPEPRCAT